MHRRDGIYPPVLRSTPPLQKLCDIYVWGRGDAGIAGMRRRFVAEISAEAELVGKACRSGLLIRFRLTKTFRKSKRLLAEIWRLLEPVSAFGT